MKNVLRLFPVLFFTLLLSTVRGQSNHYTAAEASLIHDSISHSRWDIGGSLSKYSFRFMSEFFPVGMIGKSEQPYTFLIEPRLGIRNVRVASQKDTLVLEAYLKKLHMAGFIVVSKGAIVYENYFSILPQDQHTLQSVTKVVTSLLITSLINEKKIDINLSIANYLPELKGTDWNNITVREILNMRSGIDIKSIDFETGPFTNPMHKNYQLESALGILPKTAATPASVYECVAKMKKDTVPGLQAAYSNVNTFVLGWLAEKVTGKKYQDLVTERIWQPMGAGSDAYVCLSDKGIPWPHGGISCTLRDLARFGMLFTHSEIRARKEKLISFAQLKEIFEAPPVENLFAPFKWTYQWDLAGKDGIMMKGGFGGQALYVHPEKDIVIACFNYVDKNWDANTMISDDALAAILKALDAGK